MLKRIFYFFTLLLLLALMFCYIYREDIINYVMVNANQNTEVTAPNNNNYKNDYSFGFVSETDNFHVKSRQDILNVIYTVLNNGVENFTFYCDKDYADCTEEIKNISNDQTLLSTVNNMVSPYNSYKKLYVTINTYGKADINIEKLYSSDDISLNNQKIEEIKNEVIRDNMSDRNKIKAFHDYLVNHVVYDEKRANMIEQGTDDNPEHSSHKANGPLLEGWALCSGYSDAMKLYLDQLKIPNYKISNDKHIWNLVYLDGKWLNIDLTWDDPVTNTGSNLLLHKFFLVTTDDLLKLDKNSHYFNSEYYPEIK